MPIPKLRHLRVALTALVMLAALPALCATNLALGRTATASSLETGTFPASAAVDGNTTTRWASAFSDPSWITVDLGSAQSFNHVILRWEAAFGKAYQIQTSNDNATWTAVYSQTAGVGGTEDFTFPTATARYVRMYGTVRTTISGAQYGYSLYEFEIYAPVVTSYTLTASAGANGAISPGTTTVNAGASQTFTITPAAGYAVSAVTVDGASVGAVTTYTFSNVQAAHTISATFTAIPGPAGYTWCASENGSFTLPSTCDVAYGANGSFNYQYGKTGTITFNNTTFAPDPIPGVAKSGFYKLSTVINTNLALGKTATSSSDENATMTAASAVDGNTATRWSSTFVDPSWIAIDLGSAQTFNRVVLRWEAAFGKAYQIQTSTDNATWTAVYTQSAGVGGTEDFTFSATTARYVRMYGTARTTISGAQYGYSLFEFEVYNTGVVPTTYTITASAGANGAISPSGAVSVTKAANQTFTITPAAGYVVNAVTVDGASVGAVTTYTFSNVQAAHSIAATFKAAAVNYTITASAGANGSISPSGAVTVAQAANQSFTITPAAGYAVNVVTVDGASVGAVTTYTFSNVQAAHTIAATFKALVVNYVITASAGANGSISPSGTVTVAQAANQSFTITPASGYVVNVVTVDGASVGAVTTYTFSNVQAAHTISVTFKTVTIPTFVITASAGANGSISPSGAVTVAQAASQAFTITPASGYAVSAVTVDGASVGAVTTYTFSNVQAAHTISATFTASGAYAWHDEFDGPYLDSSKWTFDIGTGSYGWGNGEWETYTSANDNISFENGQLVITAKKEEFFGSHFTSARLLTRGKFNFKHGHIEARMKFPTGGQMIWPCFWMMGDTATGWPKTNEIDIAEMFGGSYANPSGTFGDSVVGAHAFWWQESDFTQPYGAGGQADYGTVTKLSSTLGSAYRLYALDWDSTSLKAYVWDDGKTFQQANPTPYWTMTTSGQGLEELNIADYLLLNFAIGQPQSGMTSADQAALLPQKFYVDYIRVTNTATTPAVVTDKAATQPHGNLGVMADATVCPTNLALGTDANFYVWSNTLTAGTSTRPKSIALVYNTGAGWWGAGLATINRYNVLNYAAGALHVSVKTASTDPILIGVSGGDNGNSWVTLTNGGTKPYDIARDNQWHDITIPMTNLSSANFTDISQFFMAMSGTTVTANQTFEFDNIYWSENDANNIVKPVGTKYGVLTATSCDAGNYNYATGGAMNNWNASNGTIGTGATGATNSFSFAAPAAVWYGMGLAPTKLYNLSAFATGHLHFSLKVAPGSSAAMFQIGLKSPGGPSVRESWIKIGSAAYPFAADGVTRDYSIPAQEFCNSDLSAVSQLFMVSGVAGPMTMDISNIYWTNN